MAYTAWSVVANEQPSTSKWNLLGSNDASFNNGSGIASLDLSVSALSNPYKFSAYKTANQTATGSSTVKVTFETEEFDTNSNYDNVTNYRYVAPVTGFYWFNTMMYIESASTTCIPKFYKNGSALKQAGFISNTTNSDIIVGGSVMLSLSAADYIEIFITNTGASKTIAGTADVATVSSYFQGHLISRT